MKSLNNGSDRVSTFHLLSPNEVYSKETGLCPIELLAKGIPWKSQTTQAVGKAVGSSPPADSKTLLLKVITPNSLNVDTSMWLLFRIFTLTF